MNKELEQIALELRNCVQYCKEANGLPLCKNCGLDDNMISTALQRAYELGRKDGEDNAMRFTSEQEDDYWDRWYKEHKPSYKLKKGV